MNTPGNFSWKMAQDMRRISHYIFWQAWTVDVSVTWSLGEAGTESLSSAGKREGRALRSIGWPKSNQCCSRPTLILSVTGIPRYTT